MAKRTERRWRRAAEEHRAALRAFLEASRGVEEDAWARPLAPGKWSPAQVAEHLALSYEALLRELEEGGSMRLKLTPAWRAVLRWLLLPHILFHRSFPLRAVSPREFRPPEGHPARAEVLPRLRALGDTAERRLEEAGRKGARLTHPFFGSLPAIRVLRLAAVHLEHHRRQISA